MTQRDLLKGRVKRLLKDQKDMGQVSEGAVLACSSAVQVFVRDLASKMQKQAVEGIGLTPAQLKKSVLASGELNFLHERVTAIDESDVKYHKPARGGKKRTLKADAKKSTTKKARTTKAKKTATTAEKTELGGNGRTQGDDSLANDGSDDAAVNTKPAPSIPIAQALEVEEDDDYDESDSDA